MVLAGDMGLHADVCSILFFMEKDGRGAGGYEQIVDIENTDRHAGRCGAGLVHGLVHFKDVVIAIPRRDQAGVVDIRAAGLAPDDKQLRIAVAVIVRDVGEENARLLVLDLFGKEHGAVHQGLCLEGSGSDGHESVFRAEGLDLFRQQSPGVSNCQFSRDGSGCSVSNVSGLAGGRGSGTILCGRICFRGSCCGSVSGMAGGSGGGAILCGRICFRGSCRGNVGGLASSGGILSGGICFRAGCRGSACCGHAFNSEGSGRVWGRSSGCLICRGRCRYGGRE